MTNARLEEVYADGVTAREYFDQAEVFLRDADAPELASESRAVLLHNAAICACDAILQARGFRVSAGDGAHALRLESALAQVEEETEELLERLDASRARRNEASYRAGFVAKASVDDAREATAELLELARGFLPN
jgi:hypothetical protein